MWRAIEAADGGGGQHEKRQSEFHSSSPEAGVLDSFAAKPSEPRVTGEEAGSAWPWVACGRTGPASMADAALCVSVLRRPPAIAPSEGLERSNGSGEYRLRLNSLS